MNFTIPSATYLSDADVTGWTQGEADVTTLSLRKDGPGIFSGLPEGILDLDRVLQYGMSAGFAELVKPLEELNHLIHGKPIADGGVYVSLGCTDGVSKTFTMFCEPGDNVLCEQYTFGSSLNSGRAKGVNFVPIKMDGGGLLPEDLEEVMASWDENIQGPRPHMIYLIPTGQNPTGVVMTAERYDSGSQGKPQEGIDAECLMRGFQIYTGFVRTLTSSSWRTTRTSRSSSSRTSATWLSGKLRWPPRVILCRPSQRTEARTMCELLPRCTTIMLALGPS